MAAHLEQPHTKDTMAVVGLQLAQERTALVAVAVLAVLAALETHLLAVMAALGEQAQLLVLRSHTLEAAVVPLMVPAVEPPAQAGQAAEGPVAQAMPLAEQQTLVAEVVVQKGQALIQVAQVDQVLLL